jgi:phthalate 4,5-dioxygenase
VLTTAENKTLTQVGPDTPMGKTMRRYWVPICTSAQVATPDGDPLRTSLLGESFVVFRDTSGKVGVLEELCMHRGASMALGRVENNGIRCIYHGWKYATDGTILETPNHCDARFRNRLKAPAFPVREAGGLIWTYLGDRAQQPPFSQYSFMEGPDENRVVMRANVSANYLQLFEGGVDSSHVGILHSNVANPGWINEEFTPPSNDWNPAALAVPDNAPSLDIEDTAFGFHYAAKRQGPPAEDGSPTHSIRVTAVMLPFCHIIPGPAYQYFSLIVPQDDNVTAYYIVGHGAKPADRVETIRFTGLADPKLWNEQDCDFRSDWSDRLGQDRSRMSEDWSGLSGIAVEDWVIAISMGPVYDRTKEHVVAADRAVMHLRARLLESVHRNEAGGDPIGVGIDYSRARPHFDTTISADAPWQDLVPGNRESALAPTST